MELLQPIDRREEHWIPRQWALDRRDEFAQTLGVRAVAVLPTGEDTNPPARVRIVLEPLLPAEPYPDHDEKIDFVQIAAAEGDTPGWFACINEYR